MKLTSKNLGLALLAILAVAAIAALFGHPVEALAGLGMLPLMSGETADLGSIARMVQAQGDALEKHNAAQTDKLNELEASVRHMEKMAGRAVLLGGSEPARIEPGWVDAKSGEPVRVLKHGERMAKPQGDTVPSVGRLLRGIVLGGAAPDANELEVERRAMGINPDPSGGYTVQGITADTWIDNLRAAMVLGKAGALTLAMEAGQVSIAKVTADPVCSWKIENAAIPEAEPTFGKLTLTAKTVVCLCRFSVELAQDSVNLEAQLQNVIINAMAGAIDSAGLNGVTTGAAAAPSGIMSLKDRNTVTTIGAPTSWDFLVDGMYELALDNVPMDQIGAFIAHPAVWKKMRKLKSGLSGDNTPLTMPAEVAALPKLWSTAAPLTGGTTAAGIIANWRDLIFGVRQQITVRVLSQSFLGSNLQLAVLAYARCDFGAARAASFCTLEGITVA